MFNHPENHELAAGTISPIPTGSPTWLMFDGSNNQHLTQTYNITQGSDIPTSWSTRIIYFWNNGATSYYGPTIFQCASNSTTFVLYAGTTRAYLGYSTNGITWMLSSTTDTINNLRYGLTKFIYCSGNQLTTSTNGISWSTSTLPFTIFPRRPLDFQDYPTPGPYNYIEKFPYFTAISNSIYALLSYPGSSTNPVCYSTTDLNTWTTTSLPSDNYQSLLCANNIFIALCYQNPIVGVLNVAFYTSTDTITWTQHTTQWYEIYSTVVAEYVHIVPTRIIYGNGIYIAYIEYNDLGDEYGEYFIATYWTSTDAITWTARIYSASGALPFIPYPGQNLSTPFNQLTFDGTKFVNFGTDICLSTDGISWTNTGIVPPTTSLAIYNSTI